MIESTDAKKELVNPNGTGAETSVTGMARPEDCKFFDDCSSNLCPLDPNLKRMLWCPEESQHDEICRNPEFGNTLFVRTQKKIGKAVRRNKRERDDYFNYEMLDRDIVVRSGIWGIPDPPDTIRDPMRWYGGKERKWVLEHPERKQLPEEERERRRLRMKTLREGMKK